MENERQDDAVNHEKPEWGRRIGEGFAVAVLALVAAAAAIIDVVHPIESVQWIHKIAEIEPTVLAAALLIYVLFERWGLLGPAKRKIDKIERRSSKLDSIPNSQELATMIEVATGKVVDQLSGKSFVKINETAEDSYKHILRVLESVEKTKPSVVKTLRHGIFHASGATNAMAKDDQPYFADFVRKMETVSKSSEANRWNVNVLYNVTHSDRLNVVLNERLNLSSVGYKVRAMCFRDFYPVFSPMIIDDEHVFLAVFEEGKNRVSKTVYIHGERAARFFADYFDVLWADDRVKRLREDGKVSPNGIEALTRDVRANLV